MLTISKFQRYSIYLFAFSLNFETINLFNLGIDYLASKIAIVLLLVISFLNVPAMISTTKYFFFLRSLIIFFTYLTIISFINRAGSTASFFYFPLFIDLLIVLLLLSAVKSYQPVLLDSLVAFSIGTFFLAILFFLNIGVDETEDGRMSIFNINQNMLGLYACFASFTFVFFFLTNRSLKLSIKCLLIGMILLLFLLLVKTGSRVAFLSFVVGVSLLLFTNKNFSLLKKSLIVLGFIIGFIFVWIFFLKNSVISERLVASVSDGDLSNRDLIWVALFDIIFNNYWFGVGVTGYERIIGEVSPHNVLIEVLCYSGLLGLLMFLFFVSKIGRHAYRSFKFNGNILPFVLFIPSVGLILSGQIFEQKIIWLIFSYQIAYAKAILPFSNKVMVI